MHTAAGFASCAFGLLITCMHAVFRVLAFPCIIDVLGARYANVPREPLSLPYCSYCALTSGNMQHGWLLHRTISYRLMLSIRSFLHRFAC